MCFYDIYVQARGWHGVFSSIALYLRYRGSILLSNPELAESAVLASQLVLGIPRLHVLCTRITGRPLPVLEDLIYSRHARAASTLPTEMFFQSSCWHLLMPLFQYFHIGNTQILDGTHSRYSTDHFILWFPALHIWITWRMLTGVRGPEHLHRDSNLIRSEWCGAGSKVAWLFWYLEEFEIHLSIYFEEAGSQQCKEIWFRVCSLEVLLDWIPRALGFVPRLPSQSHGWLLLLKT